MAIDRRTFLVGSALALKPGVARAFDGQITPAFASAVRRKDGSFAVALLDEVGQILSELALSARGHDIAVHAASGVAVAFARQPGDFALAFSLRGGEPRLIAAPEDRRFFGHGAFSPDGRLLYATENNLDDGGGLLGVYDATGDFRRIGEIATGGIGPHEVVLSRDGRTLAVANGGYETLPATGRAPIDLAGMQPSLTFLDRETGAIVARHEPPPEQRLLSIRHLAEDARGRLWFGAQWEGGTEHTPELIGWATRDRGLEMFSARERMGGALKGYIGSVVASRDGGTIAASAPRAGRVVVIDAEGLTLTRMLELPDACGLAPDGAGGIAVTTGFGAMVDCRGDAPLDTVVRHAGVAFDNHLRRISG